MEEKPGGFAHVRPIPPRLGGQSPLWLSGLFYLPRRTSAP